MRQAAAAAEEGTHTVYMAEAVLGSRGRQVEITAHSLSPAVPAVPQRSARGAKVRGRSIDGRDAGQQQRQRPTQVSDCTGLAAAHEQQDTHGEPRYKEAKRAGGEGVGRNRAETSSRRQK